MEFVKPRTIVITTLTGAKTTTNSAPVVNMNVTTDSMADPNIDGCPRKRRRLTHLSPDERMMRRKLKNRVAAQTARDRKKEKMTVMESLVLELEAQNRKLQNENEALRKQTNLLSVENNGLRERLGCTETLAATVKMEPASPESAAGQDAVHLHQNPSAISGSVSCSQPDILSILKELAADAAEIKTTNGTSGQTKAGAIPSAGTDKVVGPSATELESLQELIKFDHIYYKTPKAGDLEGATDKMVVVSLPEPVDVDSSSEGSCSPLSPDLDLDAMEFMDEDTVASLNKLLDLDRLLEGNIPGGDSNMKEAGTTTITERINKKTSSANVISEDTAPTVNSTHNSSKKRKASVLISDSSPQANMDSLTVPSTEAMVFSDSPLIGTLSDSGYGSDTNVMSPNSDASSLLGDDLWEDSFTQLFPSLL